MSDAAALKAEAEAEKRKANSEWYRARKAQDDAKKAARKYDIDINNPDRLELASNEDYLHQYQSEIREATKAETEAELLANQVYDTYNQRAAAFQSSTPDFSERVNAIRSDLADALEPVAIRHEKGPEIAYKIATSPHLQDELARLSQDPMMFAMRIGEIASNIGSAATPKPKLPQNLPPPLSPVTGNSGVQTRPLSNDEYAAMREKMILGS